LQHWGCFLGYAIKAWIFPEAKPIGLWAKNGPFGKVPFMGYKQGESTTSGQSLANQDQSGGDGKKGINKRYIA
jgi:hypothetical protein